MRPPLIYVLHSGKLFGTERMALTTLTALRPWFEPVLLAPPGDAVRAAEAEGIEAHAFSSRRGLLRCLRRRLQASPRAAICATAVTHSLLAWGLSQLSGTRLLHLHVVHGGADETDSYGRKRWLNRLPVSFVAVSGFVRERLQAHGVPDQKITVIENSIRPTRVRPQQTLTSRVRRVAIVSRLDPIKRVDLLLDALDCEPAARAIRYDVYGTGADGPALRERARRDHPNVHFHGFVFDVPRRLEHADLLLHLCPEEPCGLVLLEAMASGTPILAPDAGGARTIIRHEGTGYLYPAGDAMGLGRLLAAWHRDPPASRHRIVRAARAELATRFSPTRMAAAYRQVLET